MWKSPRERPGLYGGYWSVSQPNLWSLSLTRLAVCGRALSCKRMIPFDSIPGRFDFIACSSTLSHQETNHISLRFFACLHFQCWANTHYAHLQSNKETTVWTCAFSELVVSIRNNKVANFCEERVLWRVFGFHMTAPYNINIHYIYSMTKVWSIFDARYSSLTLYLCVIFLHAIPGEGTQTRRGRKKKLKIGNFCFALEVTEGSISEF